MTPLEIGSRALAAHKMGLEHDPQGLKLPADLWRQCMPEVAAIYRALEDQGCELVTDTDRRAGLFDR
jgi:hypothetical protein